MSAAIVDVVYDFIRHFIEQKHYSPNYREIAAGCHIGYSGVVGDHRDYEG